MKRGYSIAVLMSTFNGHQYLHDQIESILNQDNVDVHLFIRDDGSSDTTHRILRQFNISHENIHCFFGENKGYASSFLELMTMVPQHFDYYCFADQDDVWKREKLFTAATRLSSIPRTKKVYVSALEYVNDELEHIRIRNYPKAEVTLQSVFTRMRFAGCTMLFPAEVFQDCVSCLATFQDVHAIPHDQFVLSVCLAFGGKVVVDHEPHILYRRSSESITAGGGSIMKRFSYEKKRIQSRDQLNKLAEHLLATHLVESSQLRYLRWCSTYHESIRGKIYLILSTLTSTKNLILNFEASIKILLGTF